MTELHSMLVDMLKWFCDICEEENLTYYAIAGTALGTVRHNGFIPWDDDVDIGMPREDYERFLRLSKEKDYGTRYVVERPCENKDYLAPYTKIYDTETTRIIKTRYKLKRGIFIDIFPLDGIGKVYDDGKKIIDSITKMRKILGVYDCPYEAMSSSFKKVILFCIRCVSVVLTPFFIIKRMEKTAKSNNYNESDYVANLYGIYGEKEIMKKEWFGKPTKHKFESIEIYIPENYDAHLTRLYGDYMQLPPEEKRRSHSSIVSYLNLNEPYLSK